LGFVDCLVVNRLVVARLKGGNVCIDEHEGLNETNLFDDRVTGLAVKFCAFERVGSTV
jgi:hypothetical protein